MSVALDYFIDTCIEVIHCTMYNCLNREKNNAKRKSFGIKIIIFKLMPFCSVQQFFEIS